MDDTGEDEYDIEEELTSLKQLRAALEAVRQLTEGIKKDIEDSIENHKTIKNDIQELEDICQEN